ncbi:ABC transporter ATP-binding protein/permease [Skermania piniformis]|uniref:ABC transporter ATP-binding protein/permease n=2 Tax=Skermania pinensis TaxID=39122 RepID=A0ABX8SHG5_9ACTN|nr:ABC transporter ATP-binding protein/permease [Skermania piniformis]
MVVIVGVIAAAAAVAPVYVFGELVDRVRAGGTASSITPIAVVIVVAAVVGGLTAGLSSYLISRLGETLLATLRERVVARVLVLPSTVLERAGKGDLLARIGDDVNTIGRAVTDVLPMMIGSLLMTVLGIVAMTGLDWRLGLAGLVAAPFYLFGLRWYLRRSAPMYAEQRVAVSARSQALMESMLGARTVHAYGLEAQRLQGIDRSAIRARDLSIQIVTLFTRFVGRTNRAEFIGLAVVLVTGFFLVRADLVTVGAATAAALVFHRLFGPVGDILHSFDEVQSAGASLARLVGVVQIPDAAVRPERLAAAPADTSLNLTRIEFAYDDGPTVLHNVDIRLAPGERVALVGPTGAGKSTLAAIAAGLLVPRRGQAEIGGVPLAELTAEQVRDQVAIISQEVHVFAGPLIDDLRLTRPDAPADAVRAALSLVAALPWVDALPDGLDTEVGEGGHALTAAQAQQLALARLVLRDPAVAILDEATAEAGSAGARDLEQSAAAATRGRTTLIVAHRLTQAAAADRVVVLDHGRIVEQGTHADLVAAGGGRYAQLWRAWESQAAEAPKVG